MTSVQTSPVGTPRAWKDQVACILLVDNEESSRRRTRAALSAQGYRVCEATTGQAALSMADTARPDLVILDLVLPDGDGLSIVKKLRERSGTLIMILSARHLEKTKVAAFDAGVDDYLTKPCGVAELVARIRAALRHTTTIASEHSITVGPLVVDLPRRRVTLAGREVPLSRVEYALLRRLVVAAGTAVPHQVLLREIWGPAYEQHLNLLRVSINKLRSKIESDPAHPEYILTVFGVGYRLRPAGPDDAAL